MSDSDSHDWSNAPGHERGQATVAIAIVIMMIAVFGWAITHYGAAAIERAKARTLADAVALAEADVPGSGAAILARSLPHAFATTIGPGSVHVQGYQTQAQAFAAASIEAPDVAPAVVAIVARSAQLTATSLEPSSMQATSATFDSTSATVFATVAVDLGMCPVHGASHGTGLQTFELC